MEFHDGPLGFSVEEVATGRVAVRSVAEEGQAAALGIAVGSILLAINEQPTSGLGKREPGLGSG